MSDFIVNFIFSVVIVLFVFLISVIMSSCKTTEYIEVPVSTHDTTYIEKMKIDSIYERDSIYIIDKGDTIVKYVDRYRDRYRYIHDTTSVVRIDTTTIVKEVERQLHGYDKFVYNVGKWTWWWWIVIFVALAIVIYFKLKR